MKQPIPCGCSPSAVTEIPITLRQRTPPKRLTVEFMYLDLNVCARCRATETHLEEALTEVAGLLDAVGVAVSCNKIQVQSLEQAITLDFFSSPTIRVNGSDIQLESKENHCAPCSTIGGVDTDCRVWLYQGQDYEAPPTAMLVDALLGEVCDSAGIRPLRPPIPDSAWANLKRFFEAQQKQQVSAGTEVQRETGECCATRSCC